jgi:hypothetical protein
MVIQEFEAEPMAQSIDGPRVRLVPETEQERLRCLGMDISGLGSEAIARIEEIGFDAWLNEAKDVLPAKTSTISPSVVRAPKKERPALKLLCRNCGEVFLSCTRATRKCPPCGGATDILQDHGKQLRECASGPKCLRAGKRDLPAPAAPGRKFCSELCKGSHNARQQRIQAGSARA